MMSLESSGQAMGARKESLASSAGLSGEAKSMLTKLAAWTNDINLPFRVISIGMIVMLLWARAYKMPAPGAEHIIPLVSHSPLIWWHFKLFGPYSGYEIIGLTYVLDALFIIAGHLHSNA